MKEKMKGFISGVLVTVLAISLAGGTLAAVASQTISVDPTTKIRVNGEMFVPKDATGKEVPVFNYQGTTYAPVRALAEAYGLVVGYDAAANMATVDRPVVTTFTLGIGTYKVGEDLAPGKYDVVATMGSGNFQGDVASCKFGSLNEILSAPGASTFERASSYSNLELASGDIVYIKGNLKLLFTAK